MNCEESRGEDERGYIKPRITRIARKGLII